MLNKGLRDQESIRIDNILKVLHSLTFVLKFWNLEDIFQLENELKDLGMNVETLRDLDEKQLISHLERLHFEWKHFEIFADFLITLSKESHFNFSKKAIAIYGYVQQESKTFSFEIFNKLAAAKANL
ncbi:hypothetical protein [Flavobacterium sp.]|uniref:hypothetical protein n=1 Tax=Flavobacterium sp. TaxID=239 RepID=UPI003750A935